MPEPTFFGMTPSWAMAIATGVYALATGGLALVTHFSAKRALQSGDASTTKQIKAASEHIGRQLEAAEQTAARQIEAAADNISKQIEATRDAAKIQAQASAVSNNRQAWINDLRNEVTAFLAEAELRSIVDDEMRVSEKREDEQLRIARMFRHHIYKVKLLINPTEGESVELVRMMTAIFEDGLTAESRDEIVAHTQGILKTEWERVKRGD